MARLDATARLIAIPDSMSRRYSLGTQRQTERIGRHVRVERATERQIEPHASQTGTSTASSSATTYDGTLRNRTPADSPVRDVGERRDETRRACRSGSWSRARAMGTIPVSTATVAMPMMPWPHIVLKPSLCRKSTPKSASGVTAGVTMQPYMSAWPRGSHIRARRRWSRRSRASRRRARIVSPDRSGKPPMTTRNGSPAVCASMVVMRTQSEGGDQVTSASAGQRRVGATHVTSASTGARPGSR